MSELSLAGVAGLGVFHGLNPAMGWLFAVAIGLQRSSRWALLGAIAPLAFGHEASVGMVVLLVQEARLVASEGVVRVAAAGLLLAVAIWKLWRPGRHVRWVGMRLSYPELALWSFLMSSAHGAGLMLFPFVFTNALEGDGDPLAAGALSAGLAGGVHTLAMATGAAASALVVYEVAGLRVLPRAWLDLDRVWALALVAGGVATLLLP